MTERPLRCYACAEEQPDLLDHLGEPYVCGVIADLRQRIEELELLQEDATLGKLVRRMPELVYKGENFSAVLIVARAPDLMWQVRHTEYTKRRDTPEAALEEALGKEQDEAE